MAFRASRSVAFCESTTTFAGQQAGFHLRSDLCIRPFDASGPALAVGGKDSCPSAIAAVGIRGVVETIVDEFDFE